MKMTVKNFKKDIDVENYILILIELIENKGFFFKNFEKLININKKDKPEQRIKLEGMLKFHLKNCSKTAEQCVCTVLAQDNCKLKC